MRLMRLMRLDAPTFLNLSVLERICLYVASVIRVVDLRPGNQHVIQHDRIPVASVFVVNRETVKSWEDNCSNRLTASTVRMPDPLEQRYQPMLFTKIRVYQNHILRDYDSGLTCPRILSIKDAIQSGDTIQFYYELGSRPHLAGEVCAELH